MVGSEQIKLEIERIQALLLTKNAAYGDSALQQGLLFKLDPEDSIKSRINDKLARIVNKGIDADTEDTIDDLIGYLVLLNISRKVCPGCGEKLTVKNEKSSKCYTNAHGY